jgi:hypothetical protein
MNRIKGSAIWQTNKNDVQTHKSQRFSGELGFNYEPDEHHSFGLRYMPETGIGNADRNSSGKTVTRRNDEETDRINFTTAEQITYRLGSRGKRLLRRRTGQMEY